ncbi:mersacidin family lantibiotic [Bacillus toyonensis]|jgi:hypothetical protein
MNIQGAGDVQPETTPAATLITSTVLCANGLTISIAVSKSYC